MNDHAIEEMLWRALEAPAGLEILSSDIETLKRKLYTVRAKAREKGNMAFDCLQFITPAIPEDREMKIWLVRNDAGSSNGRTSDFESGNAGSSPAPATKGE